MIARSDNQMLEHWCYQMDPRTVTDGMPFKTLAISCWDNVRGPSTLAILTTDCNQTTARSKIQILNQLVLSRRAAQHMSSQEQWHDSTGYTRDFLSLTAHGASINSDYEMTDL